MKYKILFLAIPAVIFSSCWSTEHLKTDNVDQVYSQTNPDDIEVFSTDKIGKEYTIIGVVHASVDAGSVGSISVRYLRREASRIGADAIINLRLEIGYGFWRSGVKATGTAIKYKS